MAKKDTQNTPAKRHLREIILLFSVPVGIVGLIIAFVYVPRLFANPEHDFIYCEGYYCEARYSVDSSNRLQEVPANNRRPFYDERHQLRYYDVSRDASRPINFEDASHIILDSSSKSPDGYTLQRNTSSGGLLFYGGYDDSWSLKKGIISKPVALGGGDVTFIGWVFKASWTAS